MKKHWYHVTFMSPVGGGATRYVSMSFGFDMKNITESNIKWMQGQAGMPGSNMLSMVYLGRMSRAEFEA